MTAIAGALLAVCTLLPSGAISTTGEIAAPRSTPEATSTAPTYSGEPHIAAVLPDTATSVTGRASWYCGAGSRCTRGVPEGSMAAAAGPALRVGDWRGRTVRVCSSGRCVRVTLVDFCACSGKVIDLYRAAFARLGNPSRGILRVEVTWGDGAPATLPPTSTGDAP